MIDLIFTNLDEPGVTLSEVRKLSNYEILQMRFLINVELK